MNATPGMQAEAIATPQQDLPRAALPAGPDTSVMDGIWL
jgi:hypothetical protein